MTGATAELRLVVDLANVMGSRPDGWWRDRAGAATRWLLQLDGLVGQVVPDPDGRAVRLAAVTAVLEGRARAAAAPAGSRLDVHRADRDGDTEVVAAAAAADRAGERALVVTADRGLRDRLPAGVPAVGPGWLLHLLD